MASIVRLGSETADSSRVSFVNYKINYNHCLGDGAVGTVYEVVRRPIHENGRIASLCPYIYDRIHPVDEATKIETDLCVKISKTTLRVLFSNPLAILKSPLALFSEPKEERDLNGMLQRLGATSIRFYDTGDLYAQFKTRVFGHHFAHYLRNHSFLDPTRYEFRRAFIELLRTVSRPEFNIDDIHAYNFMYDERKQRWEVVDGKPQRLVRIENQSKESRITLFLLWAVMAPPRGDRIPESRGEKLQMLFKELSKFALDGTEYTSEIDRKIISDLDVKIREAEKLSLLWQTAFSSLTFSKSDTSPS